MASGSELRKNARYSLPLTIRVSGQEATARDISAAGVYFTMSPDCELGSKLEFELVLPAGLVSGPPPRVHCLARVVRVERDRADKRLGIAAAILTYDWVRNSAEQPDKFTT